MTRENFLSSLVGFFYGINNSPYIVNDVKEWAKTDKNLLKTFEYNGKRSYIGEILKHISDTTGVSFILNSRYGVVGTPVFIFCKNMSIVDFMESILSLNSIRGGYWKWERFEKEKKISYQLIRTTTATDFSLIISKMIEDDFNKDLLQCLKAVDMDEKERNDFLKDNPVASKYKFDREIPVILKSFKSLKESAQNKVLNENEKISIPFDSLPNAQKEYISDFFSKSNGSVPQSVSFSVSRTWNGIPRLVMQWGMFVRGSIGGTPFQNKWQNELMDRWIIEGDSKVDPLGEFDKAKEMSQDDKKKDILDSVFQWARLNNINIIGHCSIATSKYQPIQGKITMAKVLGFFNNATFMHKWRGNTLLISSIQWFIKDSKNCIIDYNMLEYIKKQEPLKITDIIHISKTLNENQAKELDFRFPDLIKVIENQREELQFLAGNRTLTQRLLQPQGTPLNSASRGLFDAFHVFQVPSGTQAVRLGLGKQAFAVIEFLGGRGQVLETWPH